MQDLEKLSSEVKTYFCFYDKSLPTYKGMIPKKYAWTRIDVWQRWAQHK